MCHLRHQKYKKRSENDFKSMSIFKNDLDKVEKKN